VPLFVVFKKSSVVIPYHIRRENDIIYFCLKSSIFFKGAVLMGSSLFLVGAPTLGCNSTNSAPQQKLI